MTKQELNRDINRLWKKRNELLSDEIDSDIYYNWLENEGLKEFNRLYRSDQTFEYMNKKSILIMYRLNQSHRFVPFHNFGINAIIK